MKQIITILSLCVVLTAHAQTVKKDAQGNYTIARRDTVHTDKATGHTITDADGKVHPVYVSARGKQYWLRTSKTGRVYRSYIKE